MVGTPPVAFRATVLYCTYTTYLTSPNITYLTYLTCVLVGRSPCGGTHPARETQPATLLCLACSFLHVKQAQLSKNVEFQARVCVCVSL